MTKENGVQCIITKEYVHNLLKERKRDIHKGDCGKVLIAAGSKGMAGAAVLSGLGAYRSGAGLVRISIDDELFPIVQASLPEATCISRALCEDELWQYDAIAIGPGLGVRDENEKLLRLILENYTGIIVLDADGLNTIALKNMEDAVKNAAGQVIITPHMGEAARLLKTETSQLYSEKREDIAGALSERLGAVAVLKGAGTVVARRPENSYINTTGNPGMATGGSGDVLTGIIAGFAGQGLCPLDAAVAGVFIHGLAGDMAASEYSQHGLMAGDIGKWTAKAIKEVIGK